MVGKDAAAKGKAGGGWRPALVVVHRILGLSTALSKNVLVATFTRKVAEVFNYTKNFLASLKSNCPATFCNRCGG